MTRVEVRRSGSPHACLDGGGEMGELHRAYDWASSPVGPVESWPQSLRTAVSIMLRSHFGMYIAWGPDHIQFYNDAYRPILGSTKHPAVGKRSRDTFAESWHIIGPLFEDVLRGNAVGSEDWMLPLDRHGFLEECYFTFSYSPIRAESGDVAGVLVTVTETTRRVLGERRLRTLRDLAAQAQEKREEASAWRGAAEVVRACTHDLPGARLYVLREDGSALDEVVADGAPRLALDARGSSLPARALAARGLVEGDERDVPPGIEGAPWPEAPDHAVAVPVERPGAGQAYGVLHAATSPRLAFDADYASFVGLAAAQVAAAIASTRAHEEERRRAEALEQLDRAKTEFFSNVSHEFRTPLTLQLGPLEDLLARDDLPPSARASVEVVHRNGLRLLKLVNTLLDYSRLESGRARAVLRPADLGALTAAYASQFESAVERAGLAFHVEAPSLAGFALDPDLWEKAILNLLSNALKHTMRGHIRVRVREVDGMGVVEVEDTGVGIPAAELPRLFQRFHRVAGATARTHEGSGIGLSLVQEILRLHGGTVEVASTPGKGSTFTLRVPRSRPDAVDAPTQAPSERPTRNAIVMEADRWLDVAEADSRPARPASDASPARVLVVDDNADMRDHLTGILSRRWTVLTARDGLEALDVLAREPVDVVVSDVMMPRLDGLGLLRRVRETPAVRDIPFVVLSARAGPEASIAGLDAGADDYLVKPFTASELVARVAANLRLAEARRDASARVTSVLESISDAFFAVDRDWRLTYLNRRAHETFATLTSPRASYLGHKLWDLFPRESSEPFYSRYHEVMATGVATHLEARHEASGRWFEVSVYPTPEGLSLYNRDVTERKNREARFAALSELAMRAGLATSLDETYESALETIHSTLGAPRASILTFDDDGVMRFNAHRGLSDAYRRAVEGHSPWRPEDVSAQPILVPDVSKDATLAEYRDLFARETIGSLAFIPLRFEDRIIGKFMVYHEGPHDYTAEEVHTAQAIAGIVSVGIARRRAEAALRRSEADFRALAEALPQLVWTADGEGRLLYLNTRAKPYAHEGSAALWGLGVDPSDVEMQRAWASALASGAPFTRECLLRRSEDEAPRWHLVHVLPLRDAAGRIARWLGAATDIQALREAQDEASRSRRAVAQSERLSALGSLVSGVAHEIRTPLTIIEANTHVLERRLARPPPPASGELADTLAEIRAGVARANDLVGQLRRFTRLDLNKRVEVDLGRVVTDALRLLQSTRRTDADVGARLDAGLGVLGDPAQLEQVVLNLVGNALDATGGRPGSVRVLARRAGDGRAELVVEDDGPGLTAEARAHLFEPLFTTKADGTGLGLSIVKRIVDEHGGDVACETQEGKGTRFVVRLPAPKG